METPAEQRESVQLNYDQSMQSPLVKVQDEALRTSHKRQEISFVRKYGKREENPKWQSEWEEVVYKSRKKKRDRQEEFVKLYLPCSMKVREKTPIRVEQRYEVLEVESEAERGGV